MNTNNDLQVFALLIGPAPSPPPLHKAPSQRKCGVRQKLCFSFMQLKLSPHLCRTPTQCCCSCLTAALCRGSLVHVDLHSAQVCSCEMKGRRAGRSRWGDIEMQVSDLRRPVIGGCKSRTDGPSSAWGQRARRIRPAERSVLRCRVLCL